MAFTAIVLVVVDAESVVEEANGGSQGAERAPVACRPARRRRYRRHGFYRLKATLRELGPRVIDRRTTLGKQLASWKAELEADLGGAANLSMQERTLVDVLVRQKVLLDSLDAWVFVQKTLVNGRKREVVRVVRDRQVIVDSIARLMGQLGLKRRHHELDIAAQLAALHREPSPSPPALSAPPR